MSLVAKTPPASPDAEELRSLIETLGRRLDDAKQELKADIQRKLPSSRRFSWVLLFIAVQVVQGLIVVRYTVRAAANALDSAHIPEMTQRYSEALHISQELVRGLNQNVSTLSEQVAETSGAWKRHVRGFVRDLPQLQESYKKAVASFGAEAQGLPSRIVDRFFQDGEVRRTMAAYTHGVESAGETVQQRSDAGLAKALASYEKQIAGPAALEHFEAQVEARFEASKERLADSMAKSLEQVVQSAPLKEKLAVFWDAGLAPEGWLGKRLREHTDRADVEKMLVGAVEEAAASPIKAYFEQQLAPQGPLAAQLGREIEKVPPMRELVGELVKKSVDAALLPRTVEKLPRLEDVLRDVVKSRVHVALAALGPTRGPVNLTCR